MVQCVPPPNELILSSYFSSLADEQFLQQRQVLSLPGYDIIDDAGPPQISRSGFRYLDATSRSKKFKYGSSKLSSNSLLQKADGERESTFHWILAIAPKFAQQVLLA